MREELIEVGLKRDDEGVATKRPLVGTCAIRVVCQSEQADTSEIQELLDLGNSHSS